MSTSSGAAEAERVPGPSGALRLSATFRALRHRNFRLFFAGQLISLVGTWMQSIAQAWLVYRLTGSSLLLGTVGFAGQIPIFLLAPLGGIVADRWNRHRVVIGTQTVSMILAFILAVLTLSRHVTVMEVIVLASSLGIVNAFDIPARQAFLIEMVNREDLMNAIALNSSMFNGARIVGPAVAGVLVASIGEGWCFFANGVSFIAVIIGLLMMRLEKRARGGEVSMIEQMREGFRFVGQTRPIFALLLLIGLVSLMAMPYTVLMPIFAAQILHGGARELGILMGATGVGALLGALTLAMRTGLRGLGKWIAISCASFGGALILFSASRWFWVSVLLLVPVGYAMLLQTSSSNTLLQAMSPDRLRGRVMSVYSMMFMGMAPLGSLFAGLVADRIGAPRTVAIGGIACLVGAAIFLRKLPRLRVEARQLILEQGPAAGKPASPVSARTE